MMKIEWTFFLLFFFLFTPSSSHVGHHVPSHHRHHYHELLSSLTPSSLTSLCPSICSCKWKSGKKTASCINVSLKDLPTGIQSDTQVLHLNDNDLSESLSKPIFAEYGLTNLQKIFLSRCKISSVGDTFLTSLTNLVELDLSWNLLESIPTDALKTTTSLRRLSFNNNHRLKVIDEYSFPDLDSLVFLDLNDCELEVIDSGAFLGLKSLRTLLLSGNKLKSMPGSVIEPLNHLQELNLHGNYWSCDCSLRDLRMQMIQKNIPLSFDPSCSSPDRITGLLWSNLHLDEFACPPSFLKGDTASFIRSQHQQTQSSQKYLSSSYSSSSSSSFVPSSSSSAADEFYVTEGDDASLECSAESVPSPSISWWKNGQMISNLSLMSFGRQMYLIKEQIKGPQEKSSKLIIINSLPKDAGKYFCNVTNKAGTIGKNLILDVTAKKRTSSGSSGDTSRSGFAFASLLESFSSMSGETVAGIIFGLLIVLLGIFLCVIFILIHYKESSTNNTTASTATAATDGGFQPQEQRREEEGASSSRHQSNFWIILQETSRCLFGRDTKCSSSSFTCSCCPSLSPSSSFPQSQHGNELTSLYLPPTTTNTAQTMMYTTAYGMTCNGGNHVMNHVNGTLGKNSIIVRIDTPGICNGGQIRGNGVVTSTLMSTSSPCPSMSSGCPSVIRIV